MFLAAGGGGDAIAASILHRLLAPTGPCLIATFAWERLLVDPLPGPRDPTAFLGLRWLDEVNALVTPASRAIRPAGSSLPRLAAELGTHLLLLDPRRGAKGLRDQIRALVRDHGIDGISVVDVGGDVLARSADDPGLLSPLADGLALASCANAEVPVEVVVLGPGLDGELARDDVVQRCKDLVGDEDHRLSARDVAPSMPLFRWHPSEVTGLLVQAASGLVGCAEIRRSGRSVALDGAARYYRLPFPAVLDANPLARAMVDTSSLAAAEDRLRAAGRPSEIDDERRHAAATARRPRRSVAAALACLPALEKQAAQRGSDYLTVRRLAELLDIPGTQLEALGRALAERDPARYAPPTWRVRTDR